MLGAKYWPTSDTVCQHGAMLEIRGHLAWNLIQYHGMIVGEEDKLLPPKETVARAFDLADHFILQAEARGEIRQFTDADVESAVLRSAELLQLRSKTEFKPEEM